MKNNIDDILDKLSKSKFRSSFKLKERDKIYIEEKGIDIIRGHAEDFISKRLAIAYIPNDGKQTPMRGHPVFIAQHATATCCRNCLYKWHKIKQNTPLTVEEQRYIVDLIMEWINRKLKKNQL
jgi:hypothetical protein